MMGFDLSVIAACGVLLLLYFQRSAQTSGDNAYNTEFYLVFMEFIPGAYSNVYLKLYVSNPNNHSVQTGILFNGPALESNSYNIPAGETLIINVLNSMILEGAAKHNKSIIITATGDVQVQAACRVTGDHHRSIASFEVLPKSALSVDYVVATQCSVGMNCTFIVMSLEDDNNVTVSFRIRGGGTAIYDVHSLKDDDVISESLQRGESMQVKCVFCDMTGTLISAATNVAVFGGGPFSLGMFQSRGQRDGIVEQMMPVETLGRQYILEYNQPSIMDGVKVVALKAGTQFFFNEISVTSTRDREVFYFKRYTSELTEIFSVYGERLLVVQVMRGRHAALRDLVMNLPVPVSQWHTNYRVYVPVPWFSALFLVLPDGAESTVRISPSNVSKSFLRKDNYTSVIYSVNLNQSTLLEVAADEPFWGFITYGDLFGSASVTLRNHDSVLQTDTLAMTTPAMDACAVTSVTTTEDTTPDATSSSDTTTAGQEDAMTTVSLSLTTQVDHTSPLSTEESTIVNAATGDADSMTTSTSSDVTPLSTDAAASSSTADAQTETTNHVYDSTTQVDADSSASNANTEKRCGCRCVQNAPATHVPSETRERFIKEKTDVIRLELSVERKNLSSHVRKKTCAEDRRPTSAIFGVSLCAASFGFLVLFIAGSDLLSLVKCLLEYRDKRRKAIAGDAEAVELAHWSTDPATNK